MTLHNVLQYIQSGDKFSPNSVLITFDDGYKNVYNYAFPVLKRYGFPAVVFCTGEALMGQTIWCDSLLDIVFNPCVLNLEFDGKLFYLNNIRNRNKVFHYLIDSLVKKNAAERKDIVKTISDELNIEPLNDDSERYLSNEHIQEMQDCNIYFGAHSMSHPLLCFSEDKLSLKKEIHNSVGLIEEVTHNDCISFAYPFGDEGSYSESCIDLLKSAGVKIAFTTYRGSNTSNINPYLLNRFIVQKDLEYFFRFQMSGLLDG